MESRGEVGKPKRVVLEGSMGTSELAVLWGNVERPKWAKSQTSKLGPNFASPKAKGASPARTVLWASIVGPAFTESQAGSEDP